VSFPVWRYLQPRLVEAIQNGQGAIEKKVIIAGSIVIILVMLAMSPLLIFLGKAILVFFYGKEYEDSFRYFIVLLVGIWAFYGVGGWIKLWTIVTDSRWYGIIIYAVAFITTLCFGFVFSANSPLAMSYILSSVLLVTTVIAYFKVFGK
jgi:hypothetical protein